MRTKAIEIAKTKGYSETDAAVQFDKVKADCGAEPTTEMLTSYSFEALLGIGVARPLAEAWSAKFAAKPEPKAGDGKVIVLKEKHRDAIGTDAILREYLKGSAPAWIAAELIERTRGPSRSGPPQPCLFPKDDGTVYEAESAKWIDWIRSGAALADGMKIDNKFRKPVRIGEEKPAQTLPVDPFPVGVYGVAPLMMPDYQSRCGASLGAKNDKGEMVCVGNDALSFLRLVNRHEDPSLREKRDACEMAKTGGLDALKKAWPKASNAWDLGERPESTVPANPPPAGADDPARAASLVTAPTGFVPRFCFLGTRETPEEWAKLRAHLVTARRIGFLAIESADDIETGTNTDAATRAQIERADKVIFLVSVGSLNNSGMLQLAAMHEHKVIPVIVGDASASLPYTFLRGKVTLPRSGKPAKSDGDFVEVATALIAIAQRLSPPAAKAPTFSAEAVHAAIISAGLDRGSLLAGINPHIVLSLPTAGSVSAQHWQDIHRLREIGAIADGSIPLVRYLQNAHRLAGPRREAAVFAEALRALGG